MPVDISGYQRNSQQKLTKWLFCTCGPKIEKTFWQHSIFNVVSGWKPTTLLNSNSSKSIPGGIYLFKVNKRNTRAR